MGGFENDAPAPPRRAPTNPVAGDVAGKDATNQRALIEKLALNHFGPIAGLLCDEASAATGDLQQVLSQLAANLPKREESDRFMVEAQSMLATFR
jgi:hypothetical protein